MERQLWILHDDRIGGNDPVPFWATREEGLADITAQCREIGYEVPADLALDDVGVYLAPADDRGRPRWDTPAHLLRAAHGIACAVATWEAADTRWDALGALLGALGEALLGWE
ncbi:MAG TPA: hypothetical protein PLY56_09835 [Armatimonadota bacterium]|nr:hypothetical protein [Armatimonadota bacterium]